MRVITPSRRPLALASLALLGLAISLQPAAALGAREATMQRYIVTLQAGAQAPAVVTRALERSRGFTATHRFTRLLKGFAARLSPAQVAALRADPRVANVDVDREFTAAGSEPLLSGEASPTGIRRIQALQRGHVHSPSRVNVAVLDTGIDFSHRDLNAVHGTNCINSNTSYDDKGHGTAVSGTIAARNDGRGLVGVAPGVRVVSVKVLDRYLKGSTASLICGVEWVTSTRLDADPDNDIHVVNMSLYGRGDPVRDCSVTTDTLHLAICASAAAGVVYVASAGNTGGPLDHPDRQSVVPGAYPEVLAVTAMADSDGRGGGTGGAPRCKSNEGDDRPATFSSYAVTAAGAAHTIAAPGVCIQAILPGGSYRVGVGTSMTAPQVAGAVAVCLDSGGTPGPCAGLSPAEIIAKVIADAQAHTLAEPGYGFAGDPSQPIAGRYYGYLVRVGVDAPAGPAAEQRTAFRVKVKSGVRFSGGKGRLKVDDDRYLELRSTSSAEHRTRFIARFGDVPRAATAIEVTYSGLNTRDCDQTIDARDFNGRQWVNLDTRTVGTTEQLIVAALPGSPADYVRGTGPSGEVRLRIGCATADGIFYTGADLLRLEISP